MVKAGLVRRVVGALGTAELAARWPMAPRDMSEKSARGSGVVHDALKALTGGVTEAEVRAHRLRLGVRPVRGGGSRSVHGPESLSPSTTPRS